MQPTALIAQNFPKFVIPLIESAKHSVKIIVFDWRWYPSVQGSTISKFNQAVCLAAQRGLEVKCLVNNQGVADRLKAAGCEARLLHSKKMLHTKMLLLDDQVLVIGSHNYTQHAFSMNHEASVALDLGTKENDFEKYFKALWGV
jgi:phosphatidylserine/phosphatidylglycerophosphate/cardiolipin synthase-like enzyme